MRRGLGFEAKPAARAAGTPGSKAAAEHQLPRRRLAGHPDKGYS